MTYPDIARAAGWKSQQSVRAVLHNKTVSRATRQRILRIKSQERTDVAREFPAFHATRRLQALATMGWSIKEIARLSGLSVARLRDLRFGSADSVYRDTGLRIFRIYDELADQQGPCERTKRYASKMGWCGPLAWDSIDDQREKPGI
jgi:hypothetical protein